MVERGVFFCHERMLPGKITRKIRRALSVISLCACLLKGLSVCVCACCLSVCACCLCVCHHVSLKTGSYFAKCLDSRVKFLRRGTQLHHRLMCGGVEASVSDEDTWCTAQPALCRRQGGKHGHGGEMDDAICRRLSDYIDALHHRLFVCHLNADDCAPPSAINSALSAPGGWRCSFPAGGQRGGGCWGGEVRTLFT